MTLIENLINSVSLFFFIKTVQPANVQLLVDPSSQNASLPCGLGSQQSQAYPTALRAFLSIPFLPKVPTGSIDIRFVPGRHEVCNLSYFRNVSKTVSGASNINFTAHAGHLTSTIYCNNYTSLYLSTSPVSATIS